jgi:hypothetical protein
MTPHGSSYVVTGRWFQWWLVEVQKLFIMSDRNDDRSRANDLNKPLDNRHF